MGFDCNNLIKNLFFSKDLRIVVLHKVITKNRGKKSAGVDKIKIRSQADKIKITEFFMKLGNEDLEKIQTKAVKRVFIPKPNKKELRGLGIPTINDRILQGLAYESLLPFWEAKFSNNSYGFRPLISTYQPIKDIEKWLSSAYDKKSNNPIYYKKLDLNKCFDQLDHKFILKHFKNSFLKNRIKNWLKAKIQYKKTLSKPKAGTPQGGLISPLIANICLNKIDWTIQNSKNKIVLRYADDVLVLCTSKELLDRTVVQFEKSLTQIGLSINYNKSKEGTLQSGLEYLGFFIRLQNKRFSTRPDLDGAKNLLANIKNIAYSKNMDKNDMIDLINQTLSGYAASKLYSECSKTFRFIDYHVEKILMRRFWKNLIKINHHKTGKKCLYLGNTYTYVIKLSQQKRVQFKEYKKFFEYDSWDAVVSAKIKNHNKTLLYELTKGPGKENLNKS